MSIASAILKAPIHVYRWTLKPLMGLECRHLPTCSEYALEAIDKNGAWRGFWLMALAPLALPSLGHVTATTPCPTSAPSTTRLRPGATAVGAGATSPVPAIT